MGDIKDYNPAEEETLDSRGVAEIMERQHKNLLRDINGYIENIKQGTELKIEPSKFSVPSTYTGSTGRKLPCFFVTKKDCEFIANKPTGEKGTKFTAIYMAHFNIMEERERTIINGKTAKNGKIPEKLVVADKRAMAVLLNAKDRVASSLQKLYDRAGAKPEYQAMTLSNLYPGDRVHLLHMAFQGTKQIHGKSATTEKPGVYSKASGDKVSHAQVIGAIASTLDISEDERERLPYCNNGRNGADYQYTESVVEKVRAWTEVYGRPSSITVNGKNYTVVYKKE